MVACSKYSVASTNPPKSTSDEQAYQPRQQQQQQHQNQMTFLHRQSRVWPIASHFHTTSVTPFQQQHAQWHLIKGLLPNAPSAKQHFHRSKQLQPINTTYDDHSA
jgi:hypothetical protein